MRFLFHDFFLLGTLSPFFLASDMAIAYTLFMKVCKNCKKLFSGRGKNGNEMVFCSLPCSAIFNGVKRRKIRNKTCPSCSLEYIASKSRQIYCCRSCQSSHLHKRKILKGALKTGSNVICKVCEKEFYAPLYRIKKQATKYCSRKCLATEHLSKYTKIYGFKKGKNSPRKYKTCISFGRRTRIHRAVMENHLGRKLYSSEHIHHIDGNPDNNSLSNLVILSNSDHGKISYEERQLLAEK